jgi:queuine tRNA-ribosyltransferase
MPKQKQAEICNDLVADKTRGEDAMSLRLGDYEIHRAWEGFASIRQISSGEIMHSRTSPAEEAQRLYVEQAKLAERLCRNESESPLVLWDVGLGAAANAMAAIQCYETAAASRPARALQILSFENDLNSLRLAARHPSDFPYLNPDAAVALIANGSWRSPNFPGLTWELLPGDFLETMKRAPAPDLIFYDMFSTKTSSTVWSFAAFRDLFEACRGRAAELFTYTCSTANRAALLGAGFHVARGRNAGPKVETTIALTPAAAEEPRNAERAFLDDAWLAKWDRSRAKFPHDVAQEDRCEFEKLIREHKQFRNLSAVKRLPSTTPTSN